MVKFYLLDLAESMFNRWSKTQAQPASPVDQDIVSRSKARILQPYREHCQDVV
jgi:hypothetical protein